MEDQTTKNEKILTARDTSAGKKKVYKKSKTGRIVLLSLLGVMAAGLVAAAIWIIPAVTNPASVFDTTSTAQYSVPQSVELEIVAEGTDKGTAPGLEQTQTPGMEAAPTPTPEPTAQEQGQFDNIINIALLGIDPKYKAYAAEGGDSHTDGIVVVSVNFDRHKVDLISFPRDTFTKVPGYQGFYKINCAVDVGGEGTEQGYLTTCATLSQFLGGIPINYYVAVDHDIVIKLGDNIGGVDFDLPFSYTGKLGISYKKGYQHLDGKGIYDYMRCRKECPYPYNSDVSRTQRCREMLLAIFDKLKKEGMLTKIPDIMATVSEGLYTNLSARQIVALGTYAMQFSTSDVGSYNFDGDLKINHGWTFFFIDQQSRQSILKEVYGIDAEPIGWCSDYYADWLYNVGNLSMKYASQAKKVLKLVEDPSALSEKNKKLYDACEAALKDLEDTFASVSAAIEANYKGRSDDTVKKQESELEAQLVKKESACKKATKKLYQALGKPTSVRLKWEVDVWYLDSDICEVVVDMR